MIRKLFIRMIISFIQYNLTLERDRLTHIQKSIAHDEDALYRYQLKLMDLES